MPVVRGWGVGGVRFRSGSPRGGDGRPWSEYRTVTRTATVSLHGNTYQVDAGLVGCKVELVFSPFDLETIEVR